MDATQPSAGNSAQPNYGNQPARAHLAPPSRMLRPEQEEKVLKAHRYTIADVLNLKIKSAKEPYDDREKRRANFLLDTFPAFCALGAYTFNEEDVQSFIDARIEHAGADGRDVSNRTINLDLRCVNAAIDYARRREHAVGLETPIRSHVFLEERPFCVERLDAEVETWLLRFASNYEAVNEVPLATIMKVLLGTAMRRSELAGIKVEHLDLTVNQVTLPHTKNGTARVVPLWPQVAQLLASCSPRPDGSLFPAAHTISGAWWRTRKRAAEAAAAQGKNDLAKKILATRIHDLRHEAISRLVSETNWPDVKIMAIVGHRHPKMLSYYTKFRRQEISAEMYEMELGVPMPTIATPAISDPGPLPASIERQAAWNWLCRTPAAFQILLTQLPQTKIAENFGITEAAVRKASKKCGLHKPRRGHWLRSSTIAASRQ